MHKTALIATPQPEVSRALTEWLADRKSVV